jgi:hypothetical protein
LIIKTDVYIRGKPEVLANIISAGQPGNAVAASITVTFSMTTRPA